MGERGFRVFWYRWAGGKEGGWAKGSEVGWGKGGLRRFERIRDWGTEDLETCVGEWRQGVRYGARKEIVLADINSTMNRHKNFTVGLIERNGNS